MEKQKGILIRADEKLDAIGARLKDKEITLPIDMVGAGIFLLLAVALLFLMPAQVPVAESDIVNGRVFPTMLMVLMIICCLILIGNSAVKLYKKQPVVTCTLHLLTEVKALVILAILGFTYLICKWTDLFVAGAVFCAISFLLYFRCRNQLYYLITVGLAVVIWCAFRFGLGVRF